jgi:hypothetical protein
MFSRRQWYWLLVGLVLLPAGCTSGKKSKRTEESVKAEVTESFERLKEAIAELRRGDTEKFWDLLAGDSKDEATKKAKAFRADFAKLDKKEQAERAKEYGATADEIREKLNGYGYLRLMQEKFYKRWWMLTAAQIDHITPDLKNDEATVFYKQDESEPEVKSLRFAFEDGKWRAMLPIP